VLTFVLAHPVELRCCTDADESTCIDDDDDDFQVKRKKFGRSSDEVVIFATRCDVAVCHVDVLDPPD